MDDHDTDSDNEPGGGWRDEMESSLRAILRRGPRDIGAVVSALRVAMEDPSIGEADARATADRISAPIDADGTVSPAPVAAS